MDHICHTAFSTPAILPPGIGSGAYFGIDAASHPTFLPIASNGSIAFPTALLTHLAAINADHINTSAMISIMIVQKNVPIVPKILLRPSPVPPHPTHPIVHSKVISISFAIVTTVFFPSVEVAILFPGLPKRVNCPLLVVVRF